MSPEAKRIAIAEACGWVWYRLPPFNRDRQYRCLFLPAVHEYPDQSPQWTVRADGTERICNWNYMEREGHVPDYLNDLNAMHGAVMSQSPEFRLAYEHACQNAAKNLGKLVCELPAMVFAECFLTTQRDMAAHSGPESKNWKHQQKGP